MGIPGFQRYIEKHWKPRFSTILQGKLIVDGNGLCYELYRKIEDKYPLYGGQYPLYLSIIEKFMFNLHESGIQPVFLFDGIYDKDRTASITTKTSKIQTWHDKLIGASGIDPRSQSPPLLLKKTFLQALEHFEIEHNVKYICFIDGETDPTAVAMANALQLSSSFR